MMKTKKILDLDNLSNLVAKFKKRKRKTVLCHGVFDLLHLGHIKHFEEAKKYGDILVVTITPNKYVSKGSFLSRLDIHDSSFHLKFSVFDMTELLSGLTSC